MSASETQRLKERIELRLSSYNYSGAEGSIKQSLVDIAAVLGKIEARVKKLEDDAKEASR